MWNAVTMQIKFLFSRKSTLLMYVFMYLLVFANFLLNMTRYWGSDVSVMYSGMKLLLLSDNNPLSFYFLQYYPFLVVVPAAFSYLADANSREIVFLQARIGKKNYYASKAIAAFVVTFIVFAGPLLMEVLINAVVFPAAAKGDPITVDMFVPAYGEMVKNYLFFELWAWNQYVYPIVCNLLFGILSGILAVFALAVSTSRIMKFKVFVFIPVYALMYLLDTFGRLVSVDFSTYYFFYLRMNSIIPKNEWGLLLVSILILVVSVLIMTCKAERDELA